MSVYNHIARLLIINHGTKEDPKYIAVGIFSELPFDAKEIDMEKVGALVSIKEVLGDYKVFYEGAPYSPMYGHSIEGIMSAAPYPFITEEEAKRLKGLKQ